MFGWFKKKSYGNSVLQQLINNDRRYGIADNYRSYAKEVYEKNVIAHYCIATIAKSVADIPFILRIDDKELEAHQLIDLLRRPYPLDSYRSFMRRAVMHRLVSGNCFVLAEPTSQRRLLELRLLRPDNVEVITENGGLKSYQLTVNGVQKFYDIDPVTLQSVIIHIKDTHPLNDLKGMSPIAAARLSVEQHNSAGEWNKNLLDNYARPPGILTFKSKDGMEAPSPEQLQQVSESLQEKMNGKNNAGKPVPMLSFDMQWQQLGMPPADMDWINGQNTSARQIALAFGFPPFLLGMAEGATFNNVSEAKLSLYEETVIPLVTDFLEELAYKFSYISGKDIKLTPDLDKVSALSPRHDSYKNNIRLDLAAGIINKNEAREANSYEPIGAEGDEFYVPAGQLPLNFDAKEFANNTPAPPKDNE